MKYFLFAFCIASLSACAQTTKHNSKKEIKQEITTITNQDTMSTNTANNPEQVITALIEAMSANDAEKIRSLFNSDASQAYGDGAAKSGEAFFKWLQSDIIDRKGHVDHAKYKVNGNQVVVTGQYSSEGYTNKANFLFTVKNGEIMSWQMRY